MTSKTKTKTLESIAKTAESKEQTVPKFLKKTFDILEQGNWPDIVSWSNDGLAMLIKNPAEFAEKVLPLFFKHSNLTSFVRQLNMYDFKKRKIYGYDHSYGHEMFVRGHPELLINIRRKCNDNTIVVNKSELKKEETKETDETVLFHENSALKKVHKDLNTRLKFIEDKVKNLTTENEALNQQFQKQSSNQEYLKKVVYTLSQVHGPDNVQRIIEAVTYSKSLKSLAINNPGLLDQLASGLAQNHNVPIAEPDFIARQGEELPQDDQRLGMSCDLGSDNIQVPPTEWSLERQHLYDIARVSGVENQVAGRFDRVIPQVLSNNTSAYQTRPSEFTPLNPQMWNYQPQHTTSGPTKNDFGDALNLPPSLEHINSNNQFEGNDDVFMGNRFPDNLY